MADKPSRSPLRIFAPLALVAAALAIVLVVAGASKDTGDGGAADAADTTTSKTNDKTAATTTPKPVKKPASTYTVKTGDNLGTIAEKTRVPVDQLQEINPELDPQALVTGQKIKLRE